jgi:hypothetical protein
MAPSLPVDICAPTPEGERVCIKTGDIVQYGPRECSALPSGSTPPLASVTVAYARETIPFFDDSEILFSASFYVGIETDGAVRCLWVGDEVSGTCAPVFCGIDPAIVSAPLDEVTDTANDAAADVVDWLHDNVGTPSLTTSSGQILKGIIAVGLIALFVAIPIPNPI